MNIPRRMAAARRPRTKACSRSAARASRLCRDQHDLDHRQPHAGLDLNGDGDLLGPGDRGRTELRRAPTASASSSTCAMISATRRPCASTIRWIMAATARPARSACCRSTGGRRMSSRSTIRCSMWPATSCRSATASPRRCSTRCRASIAANSSTSGWSSSVASARPSSSASSTSAASPSTRAAAWTCFNGNEAADAAYAAANPTVSPPQKRNYKFDKILPSAGLTFKLSDHFSLYASYAKGLQVPGTDNLYNAFFFERGTDQTNPKPETTDNFDAGVRYRSGKIQAELAGWYTNFKNRLASSYDPEENVTVYRNLGTVRKYGVDGSISYAPIPEITLYAFGSYLKSKILRRRAGRLLGRQGGLCAHRGQAQIGIAHLHLRRPHPGQSRPGAARRPGQADRQALHQRPESAGLPVLRFGHDRRLRGWRDPVSGLRRDRPGLYDRRPRRAWASPSSASTTRPICSST